MGSKKQKAEKELDTIYSSDHDLKLGEGNTKLHPCKACLKGLSSCIVITLFFLGIIFVLGAIGLILAGPTCSCKKAIPYIEKTRVNPTPGEPIEPTPIEPLPDPIPVEPLSESMISRTLFQSLNNSEVECNECPYFWSKCIINGYDTKCGRGCAMSIVYIINGTKQDPEDPFCLRHDFADVVIKEWSELSVFQIVGITLSVLGVSLIITGIVLSFQKGKKYYY